MFNTNVYIFYAIIHFVYKMVMVPTAGSSIHSFYKELIHGVLLCNTTQVQIVNWLLNCLTRVYI